MKAGKRGAETTPDAAVASATECTGLMPALPTDESRAEAEAALYGVHGPKGSRRAPRADK